MSTKVYNLEDLLTALDTGGALTYVDCGSYATIHFDKPIDDKFPKAADIRFLDQDYASEWDVEVEAGMCGTLVDVYFTKPDDEGEPDHVYYDEAPF